MDDSVFIGTAAWTLPKEFRSEFSGEGSQLERYATRLNAVEINTSFYRDHQRKTYERWAASVPHGFRFSVKLSKVFTHEQALKAGKKNLTENLSDILALGEKLGCLLVQLPPKLSFSCSDAATFFEELRRSFQGAVAFEPRHLSWDDAEARNLLREFRISRVVADPQPYFTRPLTEEDFGDVAYFRLHGSPVIYKSTYDDERLKAYEERLRALASQGLSVWCIFDNTTFGYATGNALRLSKSFVEERSDFVRQKLAGGLGNVESVGNELLE